MADMAPVSAEAYVAAVRHQSGGEELLAVLAFLLECGACPRCALRLLNVRAAIYTPLPPQPQAILDHISESFPNTVQPPVAQLPAEAGPVDGSRLPASGSGVAGKDEAGEHCPVCIGVLSMLNKEIMTEGRATSPSRLLQGEQDFSAAAPEAIDTDMQSSAELQAAERGTGIDFGSVVRPAGGAIGQIVAAVRRGGHEFGSFCLEVTVPAVVTLRERAMWYAMKESFASLASSQIDAESWPGVTLREAVKWCLIKPLESALGAAYSPSADFRVALIFLHAAAGSELDGLPGLGQRGSKRQRRGKGSGRSREPVIDGYPAESSGASVWAPMDYDGGGRITTGHVAVAAARESNSGVESAAAMQRALGAMGEELFKKRFRCPPDRVAVPCNLQVLSWRTAVYVGGRYLKFSRRVSQSRWLVDEERMGDGSVQELIADPVIPLFRADGYKFQAAGREDIDVSAKKVTEGS